MSPFPLVDGGAVALMICSVFHHFIITIVAAFVAPTGLLGRLPTLTADSLVSFGSKIAFLNLLTSVHSLALSLWWTGSESSAGALSPALSGR